MTGATDAPAGAAYTVALVCLGNICRSPMAHVVLEDHLRRAGLDDVRVVSGGTAGWHVGKPMDPRAATTLADAGYDPTRHRARQVGPGWVDGTEESADLVLVMDADNRRDVLDALSGSQDGAEVRMFREVDPEGGGDLADPYYGGDEGFRDVLATVERCAEAWTAEIRAELAHR